MSTNRLIMSTDLSDSKPAAAADTIEYNMISANTTRVRSVSTFSVLNNVTLEKHQVQLGTHFVSRHNCRTAAAVPTIYTYNRWHDRLVDVHTGYILYIIILY